MGPIDQEDNMREILSQMDLEMLQVIFTHLHIPVPNEGTLRALRVANETLTLEDLMIEVLLEENHLRRYE